MPIRLPKSCLLALTLICSVLLPTSHARAADKIITLGTAGVTGVYYPAGGAICRLVNRTRREHGYRCVVESTGGSISNLENLRTGELDLGIVQSDWLFHAYRGSEVFADQGKNEDLRLVFALHPEPFTIISRGNSSIKRFDDLRGKKVYMGNPGSGMRATMEELFSAKGWDKNAFERVAAFRSHNQAEALCKGEIDAIIYAVGHPNGAVQQITSMCATRIIGVSGPVVDKMIAEHPFYSHVTIPGGVYMNNAESIKTFGVRAVLTASKKLDEKIVFEFARSVFDNLGNFKTLHPVFTSLDPNHMVNDAYNVVPMHEGAARYFFSKGMLKPAGEAATAPKTNLAN